MRLPVLMYHAVLPVERGARLRGTVPLERFREQVAWLRRRGYRALSLDALADLLEGRAEPPGRGVAITFDDGYRCVAEHALPVLEEAGYTATLFVVPEMVGKTSDWYVAKGGQPLEHAGWDELEGAVARGFEVGSHGAAHRRLPELTPAQLEDEVFRSKRELEQRLGRCRHFAYPYGAVSETAAEAVRRAGYRTACTTRRGLNRRREPLLRLRRQSISRTCGAARFRRRMGRWW